MHNKYNRNINLFTGMLLVFETYTDSFSRLHTENASKNCSVWQEAQQQNRLDLVVQIVHAGTLQPDLKCVQASFLAGVRQILLHHFDVRRRHAKMLLDSLCLTTCHLFFSATNRIQHVCLHGLQLFQLKENILWLYLFSVGCLPVKQVLKLSAWECAWYPSPTPPKWKCGPYDYAAQKDKIHRHQTHIIKYYAEKSPLWALIWNFSSISDQTSRNRWQIYIPVFLISSSRIDRCQYRRYSTNLIFLCTGTTFQKNIFFEFRAKLLHTELSSKLQ